MVNRGSFAYKLGRLIGKALIIGSGILLARRFAIRRQKHNQMEPIQVQPGKYTNNNYHNYPGGKN